MAIDSEALGRAVGAALAPALTDIGKALTQAQMNLEAIRSNLAAQQKEYNLKLQEVVEAVKEHGAATKPDFSESISDVKALLTKSTPSARAARSKRPFVGR